MYSDNALTFKNTSRDLAALWSVITNEEVKNFVANFRIQWKFIVERAPWWGGFYERLVGLTKQALKKTLGMSSVGFEGLSTTLNEVEALLNSRPLTHVYSEPNEPEPLSPALFLTGRRLTSLPNAQRQEITALSSSLLRQTLSHRNRMLNHFWKRWATEYLRELRNSPLQGNTPRPLKPGDLVLLSETIQDVEDRNH